MRYLEALTQICIGVWIGAMTGFAVTAPQVFVAFGPNRQAAGDLAGEMIWRLNSMGMVLAVVALLALLPRLRQGLNRWRTGLLGVGLALAAFGAFYIFPQMTRAQPAKPIQEYAVTDPVRVNYDKWHERSRQVFGGAILLGAVVIGLGSIAKERR
jgi:hypothetical protein